MPHPGEVFDLTLFDFAQGFQLLAEDMDNTVVARSHLIFKRRKATVNFYKSFRALCNKAAPFGNEEQYPCGKNADDAEFFDSL